MEPVVQLYVDHLFEKGLGKDDFLRALENEELLDLPQEELFRAMETQEVFDRVCYMIAVLSFLETGIEIFGKRWQNKLESP